VPGLAHDRRGSGEPLVLVHGLGSRRKAWNPVIERVAAEREVLAVDLPGFGDSPPDPAGTRLTVGDHADRLQGFFAQAGLDRPHVGGNSMGGGVALELGCRGAVRSVTVFSPIGFWGKPGQQWCRWALRAGYEAGRRRPASMPPRAVLATTRLGMFVLSFGRPFQVPAEEVLDAAQSGLAAPGFREALRYGLEFRFEDPGRLPQMPVTVAWGRRDLLLPFWTQSRRARQRLPWARHLSLPRCGHIPFHDDPELCAAVLLAGSGRRG
jgi:pimeloyl-ACP methyl ester carboxylesterase